MITFELTDREALVLLEILAGVAAAERIVVPKDSEKNRHVHAKIRKVIEDQLCYNQEALDLEVGRDIGRYIESQANPEKARHVSVSTVVADVVEAAAAKAKIQDQLSARSYEEIIAELEKMKAEQTRDAAISQMDSDLERPSDLKQLHLPFDKKNK
jgi:hypothetical protein